MIADSGASAKQVGSDFWRRAFDYSPSFLNGFIERLWRSHPHSMKARRKVTIDHKTRGRRMSYFSRAVLDIFIKIIKQFLPSYRQVSKVRFAHPGLGRDFDQAQPAGCPANPGALGFKERIEDQEISVRRRLYLQRSGPAWSLRSTRLAGAVGNSRKTNAPLPVSTYFSLISGNTYFREKWRSADRWSPRRIR